jgi:hypothetical protein
MTRSPGAAQEPGAVTRRIYQVIGVNSALQAPPNQGRADWPRRNRLLYRVKSCNVVELVAEERYRLSPQHPNLRYCLRSCA